MPGSGAGWLGDAECPIALCGHEFQVNYSAMRLLQQLEPAQNRCMVGDTHN